MEYYKSHPGTKSSVHEKIIGEYDGYQFCLIDEDEVQKIDISFTEGGNPARYSYVPENKIYIVDRLEKPVMLRTMVHEYLETKKMKDKGWSYDKAHDYAEKAEIKIRDSGIQITNVWDDFLRIINIIKHKHLATIQYEFLKIATN